MRRHQQPIRGSRAEDRNPLFGRGPAIEAYRLPPGTRDLTPDVLGPDGRIKILPASFWAATTAAERALFGKLNGIYSFPTTELVAHLQQIINSQHAIEIGAGNGVLAEALGITATDSRQQESDDYDAIFGPGLIQPVPYGPNIIERPANRAARAYRPDIIIGCWVTHKFDRYNTAAGGNTNGIDFIDLLKHCRRFVLVGNSHVHRHNPLWDYRRADVIYPDWVYSRAINGTRDFIAIWDGDKPPSRKTP